MSGRIQIEAPTIESKRQKHDHMIITMKNGTRIIFNDARRFGMLFLIDAKSWKKTPSFSEMGPEPLEKNFNGVELACRLKDRKVSIKTALLDQRVIAGVGNIYACEALFQAGISPHAIARGLTGIQCNKLVAAIRNVLNKAITEGGSTLRDYRNTKGDLGHFQHHFSVYDREGKACTGCNCNILKTNGVRRIVQFGRSTFFCPRKQKVGAAGKKL
jgi:formamidopyrimidine-DNA glycosylase